jgi:ligand-binding SRPBCC domain-containing protein
MFAGQSRRPDGRGAGRPRPLRRLMLFVKESLINASPERVFGFHERPDALRRLTPPWEPTRVVKAAAGLRVGSEALIETRMLGLLRVRWLARHTAYDPPHMFEDVQVKGPFKSWRHRHFVEPHGKGSLLRDEVEFETPLGAFGRMAAPLFVEPRLRRLFDYRHRVTREWCEGAARE